METGDAAVTALLRVRFEMGPIQHQCAVCIQAHAATSEGRGTVTEGSSSAARHQANLIAIRRARAN